MYVRRHKLVTLLGALCLSFAGYVLACERGHSSFFGPGDHLVCADSGLDTDTGSSAQRDDSCEAKKFAYVNAMKPTPTVTTDEINVIISFTNAVQKPDLRSKFTLTVTSLFRHASVPVVLYVIGDEASQQIAKDILAVHVADSGKYRLVSLDVDDLAEKLQTVVRSMQEHFSYKPGAYYSHVLFFLSTALHRVMPEYMQRAIMIDADLKFMGDIAQLYHHFDAFSAENIIGIAHDAQPVYRHLFWQYRQEHPGTLVGEPPPLGHPGFNSGVLLLELSRMRNSTLYNSLLDSAAITQLCDEFHFKGHLGDQDFFTLVSMRYKHLFYVLPCWWNRQLCQWWRDHGYSEVFELYFHCDGDVMIYHGNCNTAIP